MLKKIALPVVALVAMLILASAPAQAAVRFGITIGPPVYTYPAYPNAYPDPYVDPYAYNNYYYAPAPAPVYVYPNHNYRGWNRGGREFEEHRGRAFRGRVEHGNSHSGGHRR